MTPTSLLGVWVSKIKRIRELNMDSLEIRWNAGSAEERGGNTNAITVIR